jgi:hypothetical protein
LSNFDQGVENAKNGHVKNNLTNSPGQSLGHDSPPPVALSAKKRPIFKQIPLAIFKPPFVHRDLDGFVDLFLEIWSEYEEKNIKISSDLPSGTVMEQNISAEVSELNTPKFSSPNPEFNFSSQGAAQIFEVEEDLGGEHPTEIPKFLSPKTEFDFSSQGAPQTFEVEEDLGGEHPTEIPKFLSPKSELIFSSQGVPQISEVEEDLGGPADLVSPLKPR